MAPPKLFREACKALPLFSVWPGRFLPHGGMVERLKTGNLKFPKGCTPLRRFESCCPRTKAGADQTRSGTLAYLGIR